MGGLHANVAVGRRQTTKRQTVHLTNVEPLRLSAREASPDPMGLFALPREGGVDSGGSATTSIRQLVPVLLQGALHCLDDGELEIREHAGRANEALRAAVQRLGGELPVEALMAAVLQAMCGNGEDRSEKVLLACFRWARLLLDRCPSKVLAPTIRDSLIDPTLRALLRTEEEAIAALRLIAQLVALNGCASQEVAPGFLR